MDYNHIPTCVVTAGKTIRHFDISRFDKFKVIPAYDNTGMPTKCIKFPVMTYKGTENDLFAFIYTPEQLSFFVNDEYVQFPEKTDIEKVYWRLYNELHDLIVKYQLSELE